MGSSAKYNGFDGDQLQQIYELCKDKAVQKEQDEILLQPLIYNRQLFGQQFLSKLSLAFNFWLNIPNEKLKIIDESVLILRDNGILMDVIENQNSSCSRRGAEVAHSIYGVAITINASGYGYFLALEKLFDLHHADAGKIYTEQVLGIHRGQGMDIYWRDNCICPTETEYKQMAVCKTGGLFTLIVRLMELFSDNDKDLSRLTALLALYYHIRDDYCSLVSEKHSEIKSFGEDISEGKFNFPIIHAVNNREKGHQVSNILRQRTQRKKLKIYTIQLLEKMGSFEFTRETLRALDQQIREEVSKLSPNTHMENLLNDLLSWEPSHERSNLRGSENGGKCE